MKKRSPAIIVCKTFAAGMSQLLEAFATSKSSRRLCRAHLRSILKQR